ncbi:PAS domain S-box protein [Mucilaginibacter robiniae]|uniref:PAS domain S-box protein n=1 Tax=Mucilaginibacter robiniae TaxID=2728022 RepID=A0A7L5E166_9SPHI|nr:PAS domain S-box protein [Mucilaginibacter robiniae]QJD97102.1 PAS domain S-box protein [Mucilaginibacter robiniae]
MKITRQFPATIWDKYKSFVEGAVRQNEPYKVKDIEYWRESLLTNCVLYSIPFGFFTCILSIVVLLKEGQLFIPALDVVVLTILTFFILNKRSSSSTRKMVIVSMFYLLATVLMPFLGSFGIGSIYLMAISVFIALLYDASAIYWSIAANVAIYTGCGFIIYFKLFESPLITHYTLSFWLIYSVNFLYLNVVVVVQIRHITDGLEKSLLQEAGLRQDLQLEIEERIKRNEQLAESEGHYKSLFHANPSPMWIFDDDTLRFLQVNEAAISKYGYTHDEFVNMTLKDIRSGHNIDDLLDVLQKLRISLEPVVNTAIHRSKTGTEFHAEVRCSHIPFKGKEARLVIAQDISAHIAHVQAIEKQNLKLQEIAYMQSHIVRAPLCRVIALVDLIMQNKEEKPEAEVMEYLRISVQDLDDVIKNIIYTTHENV